MEEEHEIKKPKKSIKTTKKHWQISTVVLAILFIISIITAGFHFGTSANNVKSTIEELSGATVKSIEKENGLYKATVEDEEGNEGLLYMSNDGALLFQGAIDVEKLKEYIKSIESTAITGSTVQEIKEYSDEEIEEIKTFVTCLKEKEFKIYGSNQCGWTKKLVVDTFGGYDIVDSIYVECTENGEICNEEAITGYPTIKISGEDYQGQRTFEQIAEATGCTAPDVESEETSGEEASC